MTQFDTQSALQNQVLIVTASIEWVATTEGKCKHCGRLANGGPLAHLNLYNLPGMEEMQDIVLHDEANDTGERSNQWYFKTLGEQLEGVFDIVQSWTLCWHCVGDFLVLLTDQKEAVLLTLKRALDGTQDEHGTHTKPWTSVVFLGGEREKHDEWCYILAHAPYQLARIPLSAMLREGMKRLAADNFDLSISEVEAS